MNYLYNSVYFNTAKQQNNGKYPSIKQVNTLYDFVTDVMQADIYNKKVLVVFDIDKTLFRVTADDDGEIMFKGLIEYKMKLEPYSVELINNLTKNTDVICLTARSFNFYVDLQQYGFDLCNKCNKIELSNIQQQQIQDNGNMFYDNIFYTSFMEKGNPLLMFYNFSAVKYDKVFFIDDLKENCEQVNTILTDNNINVQTYQIEPAFKEIDSSQCINNKTIEDITSKQQAYFNTKCEILVDQVMPTDIVITDTIF